MYCGGGKDACAVEDAAGITKMRVATKLQESRQIPGSCLER